VSGNRTQWLGEYWVWEVYWGSSHYCLRLKTLWIKIIINWFWLHLRETRLRSVPYWRDLLHFQNNTSNTLVALCILQTCVLQICSLHTLCKPYKFYLLHDLNDTKDIKDRQNYKKLDSLSWPNIQSRQYSFPSYIYTYQLNFNVWTCTEDLLYNSHGSQL
jgi:hypothetical protein